MTPCVNTINTLVRVLFVAVLVFVVLAVAMRRRFEQFMLARARTPPANPKRRFWVAIIVGLPLCVCEALFADRCTGLRVPLRFRLLVGAVAFIVVTGMAALAFFVAPAQHARDPQRAVRRGFVFLGVAGGLSLAGLLFNLTR
jgi:hypothetical protein